MISESRNRRIALPTTGREFLKFAARYFAVALILAIPTGAFIFYFFPSDGANGGSYTWKGVGAGLICALVGLAYALAKTVDSEVDREADKIRESVANQSRSAAGIDWVEFQKRLVSDLAAKDQTGRVATFDYKGLAGEFQEAARSSALDKQESILREIYTQGLAQAKISFRVSIFFAAFGAGLLFIGVGLAIWKAPTDGQAYSSIVSVAAGVVVNVVSSLFFVQSNRTRRDMAAQGKMLREESQEDRRFSGARDLVTTISDEKLQDEVKAKIALQLMSAVEVGVDQAVPASNEKSESVEQ